MRRIAREGVEQLFRGSITVDSPAPLKEIAEFLGAGVPTLDRPVVIMDERHPAIRQAMSRSGLTFTPKGKNQPVSSFHELHSEDEQDFVFQFLGNIGRLVYYPSVTYTAFVVTDIINSHAFGPVGSRRHDPANGDNFYQRPFTQLRRRGVVFNILYCYLWCTVWSKFSRMETFLLPEIGEDNLDAMFDAKMMLSDGSSGGEYIINARLLAFFEFTVLVAFWNSQSTVQQKRSFFTSRLRQYERMDGKEDRRDFRVELKKALTAYRLKYPELFIPVYSLHFNK